MKVTASTRLGLVATAAAAVLLMAGCSSSSKAVDTAATSSSTVTSAADTVPASGSGDSSAAPSGDASSGPSELSGTLTVDAAASLQKTFDQLRTQFQAANPQVDFPAISYDGSSTLVTQILGGAEVDVFASADEANMKKLTDKTFIAGTPTDFATNTLQIAVQPGNPKNIAALKDLANPDLKVVVCADGVPCGSAAVKAEQAAGVTLTPASEEQNVTAVLTKVESGDADAGIVYTTDVKGAGGKVDGVSFPEAAQAVNTYPIGVLADSKNQTVAQAFVAFVAGPQGQAVLAAAGFGTP